ncbi:phage terminase small subunit P27 family [Photobacterium indicum]|uniref:Phage terminase small subunit P27 family n=1 Tax=Photobacterium indicum TaxID=81447 RepID=A0A2T3L3D5_9GAMM|nr:phage terminase small subunit P27 family [Photobacterium indicum]PSV43611.1 phage terminase small subunit P27 family [Photobacterium indicum]
MGNPRKPTNVKYLHGSHKNHPERIKKGEPRPEIIVPDVPKHLNAKEKKAFKELTETLRPLGIVAGSDVKGLSMLASVWVEIGVLDKLVDRDGYTYETTSTTGDRILKANPAVGQRSDAHKRFLTLSREFGMTPSSRGGVEVIPDVGSDGLSDFMRGIDK